MSDLQVVRWARFGHDRLYVKDSAGVQLGYWDNKGGLAVIEDQANRPVFDKAIADYRAGRPDALSSARTSTAALAPTVPQETSAGTLTTETTPALTAVTPEPAPAPVLELLAVVTAQITELVARTTEQPATQPEWADLSANRAGASAREQALALKHAAPVRTFISRCLGVKNDERAWRIGADGEEAVAAQLAKLDNHWKTLHAVQVGENGSDIDHVIIGPAGIFTINTKHHPDASIWVGGNTIMVNGQRVPYVRNTRFETKRAATFLAAATGTTHPVIGLIAIVGATGGLTIKTQPPGDDVYVLARKGLTKWLQRRPQTLTDTQITDLYQAARRSTTWHKLTS